MEGGWKECHYGQKHGVEIPVVNLGGAEELKRDAQALKWKWIGQQPMSNSASPPPFLARAEIHTESERRKSKAKGRLEATWGGG